MGDCLLCVVCAKTTEVAQVIALLFSTAKVIHYFLPKMDWATFWAMYFRCGSAVKWRKMRK
jgi:hypothetical protein